MVKQYLLGKKLRPFTVMFSKCPIKLCRTIQLISYYTFSNTTNGLFVKEVLLPFG